MLESARFLTASCSRPIQPMLGPPCSAADVSPFARCGPEQSNGARASADSIYGGHSTAIECTSVMLQIDAKTLGYADHALHTDPRY